jgi:hypothetical protein
MGREEIDSMDESVQTVQLVISRKFTAVNCF